MSTPAAVSVSIRGGASSFCVAGVGNTVIAGAPAGRCVVVGDGERAETVVVPRGLRKRIERWAKQRQLPFAVAIVRLAAAGLAVEERKG